MDLVTPSTIPAYLAYGWMDETSLSNETQLTVYMRFKNPRTAYEDIENIAESVDVERDAMRNYLTRVNSQLLSKFFIFPKGAFEFIHLYHFLTPVMCVLFALLVVLLFVLIIHNAFAFSANSRLRQLGILQSIGASPKQIRSSLVFEAMILSAIAIPSGLLVGYLFGKIGFQIINAMPNAREIDLIFTYGLPAILPATLLALLTVWLSAVIPAKKSASKLL